MAPSAPVFDCLRIKIFYAFHAHLSRDGDNPEEIKQNGGLPSQSAVFHSRIRLTLVSSSDQVRPSSARQVGKLASSSDQISRQNW